MRSFLVVGLLFLVFFATPGGAQSYSCASTTGDPSVALHAYVVTLVTGTSTPVVTKRNAFQLLSATAGQVTLVTKNDTCKIAGQAYHAAINAPGTPEISRTMVVVKVSSTRYVITDPSEKQGEYGTVIVTDNNFNVLARFSS